MTDQPDPGEGSPVDSDELSDPGEGALVDSRLPAMSAARLEQCEHIAQEWQLRWEANTLTASVDALAAAGFLDELCREVRRLRARNAALEPKCDVCGLPDQGLGLTRIMCGQTDGGALEYLLGACCEEKPFKIPPGARRVLGIKTRDGERR